MVMITILCNRDAVSLCCSLHFKLGIREAFVEIVLKPVGCCLGERARSSRHWNNALELSESCNGLVQGLEDASYANNWRPLVAWPNPGVLWQAGPVAHYALDVKTVSGMLTWWVWIS